MTTKKRHLEELDAAIAELLPLSRITAAPAPLPYQYVGTVIDNSLALLAAAANSLDPGHTTIEFTDFANWVSAMAAVHRSFYSLIHIAVEISLTDFCREERIEVHSGRLAQAEALIDDLKGSLTEDNIAAILRLGGGAPNFKDYVHAVTKAKIQTKKRRSVWVKFFDALTILRNKASHSDPSLTKSERQRLVDGGCDLRDYAG